MTNVDYVVSTVSSWASQGVPKYVSISAGGSGPTEYMVYWAHQSTNPIRHFDRFSRFSTAHGRRGVTSIEPCADVSISAATRREILTGGGGALIDFFSSSAASVKYRRRRRDSQ